jgi:hypothetical protein
MLKHTMSIRALARLVRDLRRAESEADTMFPATRDGRIRLAGVLDRVAGLRRRVDAAVAEVLGDAPGPPGGLPVEDDS